MAIALPLGPGASFDPGVAGGDPARRILIGKIDAVTLPGDHPLAQ